MSQFVFKVMWKKNILFVCVWENYFLISILLKTIFQSVQWNFTAVNNSYKQSNKPVPDLIGFYFSLNSSFSVCSCWATDGEGNTLPAQVEELYIIGNWGMLIIRSNRRKRANFGILKSNKLNFISLFLRDSSNILNIALGPAERRQHISFLCLSICS